jgi:hypothetical protein
LPKLQVKPIGVPVQVCVKLTVAGLHNTGVVPAYVKDADCAFVKKGKRVAKIIRAILDISLVAYMRSYSLLSKTVLQI